MNALAITLVAQHLKVAPNQIKRAEEWATVLFVVVQDLGARFVSKKVIMSPIPAEYKKTYQQLADALSTLSGIPSEEIYVKKIEEQEHPFAPIVETYEVFGAGTYSSYDVNKAWPAPKTTPGSYDWMADLRGIRQGFVL